MHQFPDLLTDREHGPSVSFPGDDEAAAADREIAALRAEMLASGLLPDLPAAAEPTAASAATMLARVLGTRGATPPAVASATLLQPAPPAGISGGEVPIDVAALVSRRRRANITKALFGLAATVLVGAVLVVPALRGDDTAPASELAFEPADGALRSYVGASDDAEDAAFEEAPAADAWPEAPEAAPGDRDANMAQREPEEAPGGGGWPVTLDGVVIRHGDLAFVQDLTSGECFLPQAGPGNASDLADLFGPSGLAAGQQVSMTGIPHGPSAVHPPGCAAGALDLYDIQVLHVEP
ncbi:MAG: hypothetical protein FWG11_07935 [Promicromonosporaceae bacterium]|nr:hypothetical protein [Promicromonosporaceae bacterium]